MKDNGTLGVAALIGLGAFIWWNEKRGNDDSGSIDSNSSSSPTTQTTWTSPQAAQGSTEVQQKIAAQAVTDRKTAAKIKRLFKTSNPYRAYQNLQVFKSSNPTATRQAQEARNKMILDLDKYAGKYMPKGFSRIANLIKGSYGIYSSGGKSYSAARDGAISNYVPAGTTVTNERGDSISWRPGGRSSAVV